MRRLAGLPLAAWLAGCTYVEPELLPAAPPPPVAAAAAQAPVAPARPGSLVGTLRGPAPGLIARHAAGVVGGNTAGVVGGNTAGVVGGNTAGVVGGNTAGVVGGNTAGVVGGNTAGYAVLQAEGGPADAPVPGPSAGGPLAAPVAGATVTLCDAGGAPLAAATTTDAAGHFRFDGVEAPGRVLVLKATYRQEGHDVELTAAAVPPMAGEELAVAVDPATTLVAKKLATEAGGTLVGTTLDAGALARMAEELAALLDARDVVAAALLPAERAAETFDAVAAAHPTTPLTLRPAAEDAAGASPPAGAPSPAPLAGWRATTVAGGEAPGFADGAGPMARFCYPQGLAADGDGAVYVADYRNHRIRRIGPDGAVTTLAGDGVPGLVDGPAATARFNHPRGLAWHRGALYVVDAGNMRLRRLRAAEGGWAVDTVAGDAAAAGGERAFVEPRAVAADPTSDAPVLYVADPGALRVRRVALAEGQPAAVTTVDGLPSVPGVPGQLAGPQGVAVGADGALYVADAYGNAVWRKPLAGPAAVLAGGMLGLGDGTGVAARFAYPGDLAAGPGGALYVADVMNHALRAIDPQGRVRTLAGAGEAGEADGVGQAARFFRPGGLAVTPDGAVWVADTDNHRVRKLTKL